MATMPPVQGFYSVLVKQHLPLEVESSSNLLLGLRELLGQAWRTAYFAGYTVLQTALTGLLASCSVDE